MSGPGSCRVCGGALHEFLDLGTQPLSDAFVDPAAGGEEFFYELVVGACERCTMVQLADEVPRELMFRADYPYRSSGSAGMREHFRRTAEWLVREELADRDPFVVELGSNDGVFLRGLADAGIRHLGVEPSAGVARLAQRGGLDVLVGFFEEATARDIVASCGKADAVYAANTLCHIPYVESVLAGVRHVLRDDGVFVFEDPYFGDVLDKTAYDQIYDEHFYLFTATSVDHLARQHGLDLVDVQRLPVHGGELRYTLAPAAARAPSPAVAELLGEEARAAVTGRGRLERFAGAVRASSDALVSLLARLRDEGRRVLGFGATAKSATVLNYGQIDASLVSVICDSTPAKQGRLSPGMHIPVEGPEAFASPYPDYAVLFAWNHAEEIMAKEAEFRSHGGRWITYVPRVAVA